MLQVSPFPLLTLTIQLLYQSSESYRPSPHNYKPSTNHSQWTSFICSLNHQTTILSEIAYWHRFILSISIPTSNAEILSLGPHRTYICQTLYIPNDIFYAILCLEDNSPAFWFPYSSTLLVSSLSLTSAQISPSRFPTFASYHAFVRPLPQLAPPVPRPQPLYSTNKSVLSCNTLCFSANINTPSNPLVPFQHHQV